MSSTIINRNPPPPAYNLTKESTRDYSIDLLRLLCMMMVVTMHYYGHGGSTSGAGVSSINFALANGMSLLSHVGVDCFFMISGFFLKVPSKEVTWQNQWQSIFKLWIKVFLYSVSVYLALVLGGIVAFDNGDFLGSLFPVFTNQYWFMTVFFLIMCLRPFIARALNGILKKEYIFLIIALGAFDMIQCVYGHNAFREKGAGLLNALYMVVLGYGINNFAFMKIKGFKALSIYITMAVLAGVLSIIEKKYLHMDDAHSSYYNSPFIVIASVAFFGFVTSLNVKWKFFSTIAPFVLAIYLINDHPLMQQHFWKEVLHCENYCSSLMILPHYLICLIGFVVSGIAIDYLLSKVITYVSRGKIVY